MVWQVKLCLRGQQSLLGWPRAPASLGVPLPPARTILKILPSLLLPHLPQHPRETHPTGQVSSTLSSSAHGTRTKTPADGSRRNRALAAKG